MGRKLALKQTRVALDQIEGQEGAYLNCLPVTIGDLDALTRLEELDGKIAEKESLRVIVRMITDHFVSGKLRGLDGELFDAAEGDLSGLPVDAIMVIFGELTGEDLMDPKGQTATDAPSTANLQPSTAAPSPSGSVSETQSSSNDQAA